MRYQSAARQVSFAHRIAGQTLTSLSPGCRPNSARWIAARKRHLSADIGRRKLSRGTMFPIVDRCLSNRDTPDCSMCFNLNRQHALVSRASTGPGVTGCTRVKTLHNPYTLSFSQKRVSRLLRKLDALIGLIERDYYLDREHFQLLLESHWLHENASAGTVFLPAWDLYLFAALNSESITSDPETHAALLDVTAELRN
jgi:hypothetical protein